MSAEPGIEVVGDAGTVASALVRLPAARPDVAILDVRLPDGDGISACRDIRSMLPDVACLMFTAYEDDQALLGAVMAGAAGYVLKGTPVREVVEAVRVVAGGRSVLDAGAAQRVMAQLRGGASGGGQSDDRVASLTAQERRVLDLIGEGLTNRQIAERMSLAEKTAKNYVSALLLKLGLQRRSQAAVVAVRHANSSQLMSADAGTDLLAPADYEATIADGASSVPPVLPSLRAGPATSIAAIAPRAPNWMARSARSSEPPPAKERWIQSTTPPRPSPGDRKSRSARLPSAPPSTAARQSAAPRPETRAVSAAAIAVMTRATIVTRIGYPEKMLPLAPWFLTTRTVSQPSEDPSRIRPATTSDLVT